MTRKALGRGLKALIPEGPEALEGARAAGKRESVPLDRVRPNPFQPRSDWPQEEIEALAASLKEHGLLEPILVRPAAAGGYEVLAGERRVRAARLLGWASIDAVVRSASDEEALELALVENLQRQDLNPVDEARGYRGLIEQFGWTHEEIARRLGRSRAAITNTLRLLKLPQSIQDLVSRGTLSEGHARCLLMLPTGGMQENLAQEILRKGLSVRQAERRARLLVRRRAQARAGNQGRQRAGDMMAVQEALTVELGLDVRVTGSEKAGRIVIRYSGKEQLEGLLSRLGITIH
jgi:ParB family chromosome partitioning protein